MNQHTPPDHVSIESLLQMLATLPAAAYASAVREGYGHPTEEIREAFESGVGLATEAITEWLTNRVIVELPDVVVDSRGDLVVEISDTDQAVTGFRDFTGEVTVETSHNVWTGEIAEQVALATLAVLRGLAAPVGGVR